MMNNNTSEQLEFSVVGFHPQKRLPPIIKWAGGKESELVHILPRIPASFNTFIEPFVGGGAVYFSVFNHKMMINDYSHELMGLYQMVKDGNQIFFHSLRKINYLWMHLDNIVNNNSDRLITIYRTNYTVTTDLKNIVELFISEHLVEFNGLLDKTFNYDIDNFVKEVIKNITQKMRRMNVLEKQLGKLSDNDVITNIIGSLKSAYYMHFRYLYNYSDKYGLSEPFFTAVFYFIREFCYASMFRYNKDGKFNVPYGGIQYNNKDFLRKILILESCDYRNHLANTDLHNLDFEKFLLKIKPNADDFIFLDPPYDSDFSTYAKNSFSKDDQTRLASYLYTCKAKFMMIIKSTPFILDLYKDRFNITSFEKQYVVSFQNRNNKKAEHLLITNY